MTAIEYLINIEFDVGFWGTVSIASVLKWLFTPDSKQQTKKQATAGIVAGAACAYYGTDYILGKFDISITDRDIVVIGLVFTGEHIVRTVFNLGPLFARKLMNVSESEYHAFNKNKDSDDKK